MWPRCHSKRCRICGLTSAINGIGCRCHSGTIIRRYESNQRTGCVRRSCCHRNSAINTYKAVLNNFSITRIVYSKEIECMDCFTRDRHNNRISNNDNFRTAIKTVMKFFDAPTIGIIYSRQGHVDISTVPTTCVCQWTKNPGRHWCNNIFDSPNGNPVVISISNEDVSNRIDSQSRWILQLIDGRPRNTQGCLIRARIRE